MKKSEKLLEFQKKINDLEYTILILDWELKVSCPEDAMEDLIALITKYENELFTLSTSKTYGDIITKFIKSREFKKLSIPEQNVLNNLYRKYEKNKCIPKSFYQEYVELKKRSNLAWKKAKEQNNYELFKPYLKKMIHMTKKYYRYIDKKTTNLYDVMLDQYATGINCEVLDPLFNELKTALKPLIPKKGTKVKGYNKKYSESELMDAAKYVLEYIGFDLKRGCLGIYPHGFTENLSSNDVRIAFRHGDNPLEFLSTIIHEGGHGIFEQNVSSNINRWDNRSLNNLLDLHESQSRFYENILGRNINFWEPIYKDISKILNLDIPLEELIAQMNHPVPSLIRTKADELTYCMHIIIRYEIERDLFNGKISVDDLPQVWNEKMLSYLNVVVKNDADGLMQDVHWSEGDFGYFPSYLLGTIYDGMFKEQIEKDLGSIDNLLKTGQIKEITNYLIDNIYKNGGAYTSIDIIKNLCHENISVKPIIRYFEEKYAKKK